MLPVEAQEGREVDVGEPVAVRAHEGFLLDVAARAQQPAAGRGELAGLREGHRPARLVAQRLKRFDLLRADVHADVRVHAREVDDPAADDIAFVAKAEHEIVHLVPRVVPHDVPEDRPAADLHHRLRAELGLLTKAGALTAAEDDHPHPPFTSPKRRHEYGTRGSSGGIRTISFGSCGSVAQFATSASTSPSPMKPFHTPAGTRTRA